MNAASREIVPPSEQEVCTVVVLYDGNATRARAMAACDYLVHQFWNDVELKFHWWRTDFLRDDALAGYAAVAAVAADFLIICTDAGGELSPALESWFESWVERRGQNEGALVDLTMAPRSLQRELFLREVSRRGKFDYLTAVQDESGNVPDQNGPVRVDDLLAEVRPPSHYGLNE